MVTKNETHSIPTTDDDDILPEVIRIFHRDFDVVKTSPMENFGSGRLAHIDFIKGEIGYIPLSGSETADSILHEVLHGLYRGFDLGSDPEQEEHFVTVMATGLITVMRDNPTLFDALQDMIEDK